MTVATTASPRSSLRSCRSMAVIARISSPSTRTPRSSTAITRSASPSNASPASARASEHRLLEVAGVRGAAAGVDVHAVGRRVDHVDGGAQCPQRRGPRRGRPRRCRSRPPRADCSSCRPCRESTSAADVVVECAAVLARHADAHALGPGFRLGDRERAQLLLHLQLERLGDLAPAGREELDAVVAVRVVAGGDHRGGGAALTGDVGDAGRGEHPDEHDVGTLGAEPGHERGLEHRTRAPGVAPDDERLVATEHRAPRRGRAR